MAAFDDHPQASAVEPPEARFASEQPRRRHPLVVLSGVTLAASSLPALGELGTKLFAIALPAVVAPYLCGIAFAVIAATRGPGGLRIGIKLLRAIAVAVAIGGGVVMFIRPAFGILEVMLGLLCLVGVHAISESRAAVAAIVFGTLAAIWFGILASWPNALAGVVVAVFASIGLALGGLRWLRELSLARRLPPAIARPAR